MRLIQNMTSIAEIRMAVIGGSGVGKTALVVRFLTRRFIGDYERNAGNLYSREVQVDGEQVTIQVQDTPGVEVRSASQSNLKILSDLSLHKPNIIVSKLRILKLRAVILIGLLLLSQITDNAINLPDHLHLRRVDPQQGQLLASALGCSFYEVSASEDYSQVHQAFHRLCRQLAQQQQPPAATSSTEKRRSPLIPRPKSPNMQDLKRRFRQALSAKVRTVTSV
uniref:small monomeric GTPase n=1 Tax=Gasterosteus aculeatus TaxID=69293 RepID=G3PMF1_GASAC